MNRFFRLSFFVCCGVAGYAGALAFLPEGFGGAGGGERTLIGGKGQAAGDLAGRALVAEWERKRGVFGNAPADFEALYAQIEKESDEIRRAGFRATLLAEWAKLDPAGALKFLDAKGPGDSYEIIRCWARADPRGAMLALMTGGPETNDRLGSIVPEIARRAPELLAELVSKAPNEVYSETLRDAFRIYGEKDLGKARAVAESVTGRSRSDALAGVAAAWVAKDAEAALAWAQGLEAGVDRNGTLYSLLHAWAKVDPVKALEHVDLLPDSGPGSPSTILDAAVRKNLGATLDWLEGNPEKYSVNDLSALGSEMGRRLQTDFGATMREFATRKIRDLHEVFGTAVYQGYGQRDEIWGSLQGMPAGERTDALREAFLAIVAQREPDLAIQMATSLADGPAKQKIAARVARSSADERSPEEIERLWETVPPAIRPQVTLSALSGYAQEPRGVDGERWVARVAEIPASDRRWAYASLSAGWAKFDPEAAAHWAEGLGAGMERVDAIVNVASAWSKADLPAAEAWLEQLPVGIGRDNASSKIAASLAEEQPEGAWDWAVKIGDERRRLKALRAVYGALRKTDPAMADALVEGGNFEAEQKQQIRGAGKGPQKAQ